jgi:hypothetical protein
VLTPTARAIEIGSLIVIALGVLIGGKNVLVEITHFPIPAVIGLAVLGIAQVAALPRNYASGGPLARIRVSRDVAFVAAIVAAIAFVLFPARWSLGATISAVEFGLAIELLARFSPRVA